MEEALKKIKLIVFDVDGVLTTGSYLIDELGNVRKEFFGRDIDALRTLAEHFEILLMSKSDKVNPHFAKRVGVNFYYIKKDRKKEFLKILREKNLNPEEAVYIGDALQDIGCFNIVPLSFCPADADEEIKCVICERGGLLKTDGGRGVAVEIYHLFKKEILRRRKFGFETFGRQEDQ